MAALQRTAQFEAAARRLRSIPILLTPIIPSCSLRLEDSASAGRCFCRMQHSNAWCHTFPQPPLKSLSLLRLTVLDATPPISTRPARSCSVMPYPYNTLQTSHMTLTVHTFRMRSSSTALGPSRASAAACSRSAASVASSVAPAPGMAYLTEQPSSALSAQLARSCTRAQSKLHPPARFIRACTSGGRHPTRWCHCGSTRCGQRAQMQRRKPGPDADWGGVLGVPYPTLGAHRRMAQACLSAG